MMMMMMMLVFIGDVMGPALGGLDQLLTLPTGCGEQNMLRFAPNIYVLEYLTNTGQLTSSVREKAINFLRTGTFNSVSCHRRSRDFFWGALLSSKKLTTFF